MQRGNNESLAMSRAKVLHNNVAYFKKKLRDRGRVSRRRGFYGEGFAHRLEDQIVRPVHYEVEPGDEQIFEDPEQRDLDGVPSLLALRADRNAG